MFYQLYEFNHAALQPFRAAAEAVKLLYTSPINPFSQTTAGRSIAVDPRYIPLGAPVWLDLDRAEADGLWIAQDTGGAIKGPGRVDIYVGHGKQADAMAPLQWSDGKLYLLVKKVPPRER